MSWKTPIPKCELLLKKPFHELLSIVDIDLLPGRAGQMEMGKEKHQMRFVLFFHLCANKFTHLKVFR